MKIVLTGGGSGGHITPLLALAHELKALQPDVTLVYIGQRGDSLADVPAHDPNIDEAFVVRAGKLRRYHGEGLKQLLDVPTVLKNTRDAGRVIYGLGESRRLLKKLKPDLIFIKGGFVGVPVGLAAAQLHIPFITHDSDAIPGLANRIIARWAVLHAVALPKETYKGYPQGKTVTVGIPVSDKYQRVDEHTKQRFRKELGLEKYEQMLFVTGGGNGARDLNDAVARAVPQLLQKFPELVVVQTAGRQHETALQTRYSETLAPDDQERVIVKGFIEDLYRYSGAADVIVMRAGATNIAEFAVQGKACIFIPNPALTGGHQVKNAEAFVEHHAAVLFLDKDLGNADHVEKVIGDLLASPEQQRSLSEAIHSFAHPHAAKELAELILRTLKEATR
jgi:UDP-N-acetylglucosamine--N-acetylmuramyl-(pentapeptide) pyrophosphoryl-undecaprenol N-acetylglucosamine transferase